MTRKMATLGQSAFEALKDGTWVFLPVDIDREKEPLRRSGREDGGNNFPGSDAVQLTATEQDIVSRVAQTAEQTYAGVSDVLSGYVERLSPIVKTWEPEALKGRIRALPKEMEDDLNNRLLQLEITSEIQGSEWRHTRDSYDKFVKINKLEHRPPDYLSTSSIILWFLIIMTAEVALNATLLWELTGILLALGQTVLITAVNVLFGAALVGLFFRYKNHVSWGKRFLILICPAVLPVMLAFNFAVAHYRDALVEAKTRLEQLQAPVDWDEPVVEPIDLRIVDHTQEAMKSFLASPFAIDSVLSALLIIVGFGFFGVAAYKWYSMWDPYPGYRKRHLDWEKKYRKYSALLEEKQLEIVQKIKEVQNQIWNDKTSVIDMRQEHSSLTSRACALKEGYANWVAVLQENQKTLLSFYRDSNRKARSDVPPDYFNESVSIESRFLDAPAFSPPELQHTESVIQAVNEAEEKSRQITDDVWRHFYSLGRDAALSRTSQVSEV